MAIRLPTERLCLTGAQIAVDAMIRTPLTILDTIARYLVSVANDRPQRTEEHGPAIMERREWTW